MDEVHGWFESLLVATDFRADLLFGVVRQLDEAAQPFLRRLARDCLQVQGVLQARWPYDSPLATLPGVEPRQAVEMFSDTRELVARVQFVRTQNH